MAQGDDPVVYDQDQPLGPDPVVNASHLPPRGIRWDHSTLQRQNAENLKQIFPEKEYRGLSPNFHIHVSVSKLYITMMGLPFLLEEICGPILGINQSLTDTKCGNWG